jgi:hypothetical protein
MKDIDTGTLQRRSFELDRLVNLARISPRPHPSTAGTAAAEAAKDAFSQTLARARLPKLAFVNPIFQKNDMATSGALAHHESELIQVSHLKQQNEITPQIASESSVVFSQQAAA